MSFNICCLSGMLCETPVVSKKSGHVFEKRLILKHVDSVGRCPITKHELSKEDLIEVKSDNSSMSLHKPRNAKSTSMPGMFTELQSEWDRILLETTNLKKEYDLARQELGHSMYQYDASTRVIANLLKERDMAKEELANYQNQFGNFDEEVIGDFGDEFNNMGVSKDLINRITEMSYKLIADRKNKKSLMAKNEKSLPSLQEIKNYNCIKTFNPFEKLKSNTILINPIGITCSDIHNENPNYILVGSNEGSVSSLEIDTNNNFNLINNDSLNQIHKRKINEIKFYPRADVIGFATCSEDSTAKLMIKSELMGKFEERYLIKNVHNDSLTGVSFHPLEEYALLSSLDGYWSFHNLFKGVILHKELNGTSLTTIRFHPDGGIFGTGQTDGVVKLWDITSQQEIMKLHATGMQNVSSISFSENGYYLASCGEEDKTVMVWDIRKKQVVKTLELNADNNVNKVEFDKSGNYLTLAGNKIGICDIRNMELFTSTQDSDEDLNYHKNICTSVKFGNENDGYYISTCLDGDIKIHG